MFRRKGLSRLHLDTAHVRPGEELNLPALADWPRGRIAGAERGITLEQFPDWHSNLTYLLRMNGDGLEYVLRRGPLGPVAPKAHDMGREFRVLQMVHPHFREAPNVFHLCEDTAVLGGGFFVLAARDGVFFRGENPPQLATMPTYGEPARQAIADCP